MNEWRSTLEWKQCYGRGGDRLEASVFALLTPLLTGAAFAQGLADPSFEDSPPGTDFWTGTGGVDLPCSAIGEWRIDHAIVRQPLRVVPADGVQYLRARPPGSTSDVYQLVDVSSEAAAIDAGSYVADLSAQFNAPVIGATGQVSLRPFAACDVEFADVIGVATFSPTLYVDGLGTTWETASLVDYVLPVGTRYIAVGVHMPTSVRNAVDDVVLAFREVP